MRNIAEDTAHNLELNAHNPEPNTHNSELDTHSTKLKTRNPWVQRSDPLVNELMIRRIMAAPARWHSSTISNKFSPRPSA